jgi:hypothetical protein
LVSSGDTLFSGGTMTVRGAGTTSATNAIVFQNSSGGTMALLNNAGNLLIGTSTDSGYKLDVNGDTRVNGDLTVGTFTNKINLGQYGSIQSTTAANVFLKFDSNNTILSSQNGINLKTGNANSGFSVVVNSGCVVGTGSEVSMNASAKLQVDSTTRGFLQPRTTTTQKNAIATPATGLTVYDTTLNTNEYYDGAAWRSIASQAWVQSQGYLTGFTEGDTLQIVSDRGRVTTSLSSTGTTLVASATTGYTGVFFNYSIGDGTNYRAGTVTSVVSSGSTVEFTETSTNDIGNTAPVSLSVGVGGGFINLSATTTTTGWTIKVVPQGI